ncbi:Holliday junction resolvasome RuvABC endonuclease subunit [Mesorhizobium sp. J18]|uniref:crossover junction endodeoxyribonuclease RuvC n=1 Tax=Mesorhizobium sp. J18 TaxID=935263 RepID=UPI00119A1CEC|nr:crossover junction endodeoxyribonuclease RuvC [Mesorhizobium sp. J18]TWG90343.1 Holliday junction resolvasome RuvABC endonuclease subunit [Mesorhizobium sp. J18]
MIILGLDVATKLGWAVYDTSKTPSSIISGSIKLEGDNAFEKAQDMRRKLPKLIREHQPDFAAMEAPLEFAPQFKKMQRTLLGEEETTSTINSKTIAMLNRLAGAAQMAVQGQNVRCIEVRPQTWQTIIPKTITGKPKQRAQQFCDMLKIVSPNMDARDAAIIAYWAAGHCQELRLLQRAREAA